MSLMTASLTVRAMTAGSDLLIFDLETYSSEDITNGVYRYTESPDFEIILFAAAWNDGPVKLYEPKKDAENPEYIRILEALKDRSVTKVSHNTAFERNAIKAFYGTYIPPEDVVDTMILCAYNGLPMSLDAAGMALDLKDKKMKEGAALINYFCKPCKPTISNGGRTRNFPEHSPAKWETFCDYCVRDVVVAQNILFMLKDRWSVSKMERRVWAMDARVNERGVLIDKQFVEQAKRLGEEFTEKKKIELAKLTACDNPNSVSQLKDWFAARGIEIDSLDKKSVEELMKTCTDPIVRKVLELRKLIGKTSTKKYEAMLNCVCRDGRVRGLTQYYGAGRTGRFAGRLVQLQNLPQNHIEPMTEIRNLVKAGDSESLEMCFDSLPDVLSQLIRSALIAKEGHTLLVADYSAIEARVTAYLAQCQWRLDTFANGGDIYCASASQMFHVPVEKHGVNGHLRQRGKVAELALGYGGGIHALETMGGKALGLQEDEMQEIVDKWRLASPEIPKMWRDTERAAKRALEGYPTKVMNDPVTIGYYYRNGNLYCKLPSGRCLVYWGAHVEDGKIVFMQQNQVTRKWEKGDTWGGKLVENIVQAFARDCLAEAMVRLEDAGYNILFSVHDEVICEQPIGSRWEDMAEIMSQPIDWAPGLLLTADGYETPFYKKA